MKRIAAVFVLTLTAAALAQTTTQPVMTEADHLKIQVAALQAQVTELKGELAAAKHMTAPTTRPSTPAMSPIEKAIAEHTLVKGMTIADADKSLGVAGDTLKPPFRDNTVFQWTVPTGSTMGIPAGVYKAFVSKGVLIQVDSHNH